MNQVFKRLLEMSSPVHFSPRLTLPPSIFWSWDRILSTLLKTHPFPEWAFQRHHPEWPDCSGQKSKCKQAAHEDASNCTRASSRHICQPCTHSDSFWINAIIVCILILWAVGGPDNSHKLSCGLTLTYEVTTTSKHCHLRGCLEGFPGSVANRSSGKWTVNN